MSEVSSKRGERTSPAAPETVAGAPLPLILDLDGTLIATDLLAETLLLYVRVNPLRIFVVLVWLMGGRAKLKRKLAEATTLDIGLLPVREDVAAYARRQKHGGREIHVATAADRRLAEPLMLRFDFLSSVMGSEGGVNLKGRRKAAALTDRFPHGFIYVGDAAAQTGRSAAASPT